MITLAAFYKDLNETKIAKKLNKRIKTNTIDYRDTLYKMQKTLAKTNPSAKFIIKTCNETPLDFENVFRTSCADTNLIESFVKCDLSYVQQHYGKTVMVGSDHLICGDLNKFFEEDYDFATCMQNTSFDESHRTNVMNFMFVNKNKNNHDKLVEFFDRRYEVFKSFPESDQLWWGDQKSLSVTLDEYGDLQNYYKSNGTSDTFNFKGLKIKLFKYPHNLIIRPNEQGNGLLKESVIVDFAGAGEVKKHVNTMYQTIMEKI